MADEPVTAEAVIATVNTVVAAANERGAFGPGDADEVVHGLVALRIPDRRSLDA